MVMVLSRKNKEKSVVIDTGAFIRGTLCQELKLFHKEVDQLKRNQECETAYSKMIERRHAFLWSDDILNQYKDIARRKFGQNPIFIRRKIDELKSVHNIIVKKVSRHTIEKEMISSRKITNIDNNDRYFIDLACNRADFLISEESKIKRGLGRRFTDCKEHCGFSIRTPVEYCDNEC